MWTVSLMFGGREPVERCSERHSLDDYKTAELIDELRRRGVIYSVVGAPSTTVISIGECPHSWNESGHSRKCRWCGIVQRAIVQPEKILGWEEAKGD
jgi:hypothetical protein